MNDDIQVWGIETNNLQNIDVSLAKNAINLIIGPSGSGKSSLAYDTIAQIGQHEFMAMFADNVSEPNYKVKGFRNMIAAVPIKQTNYNNNMRSTIGTYFGLNRYIGLLFGALTEKGEEFFVLNKKSNLCERCFGMGVVEELDINKIINFTLPLKDNPVRCWNKYKEFYRKIIVKYCKDVGIDPEKSFQQLSERERKLFLFGESKDKYSVIYKKVNSNSSRTTKFYGVMLQKPMIIGTNISDKFFSDVECPCCQGKKYSAEHDEQVVEGLSIGDYMTTPFSKLKKINKAIRKRAKECSIDFALDVIDTFLDKAVDFNLGHLFFHRAIPTLSGGELQRLRMVQVFNTQLSDLLIVLDEPLGGLSGKERQKIYESIIELSKRHTVVIVDHSDIFVKNAATIIALGEKSGKDGGKLIDAKKYLKQQAEKMNFTVNKAGAPIKISLKNDVYHYSGVDLTIAQNSLNLITGESGIGKSTMIREYFPQFFESYVYINQKPIVGNRNSNVATCLDIANDIFETFAKKAKKSKDFFSNNTGSEGCCPICAGAGFVEYGNDKDYPVRLECADCSGTGFNKLLKKYKINDKSIFDIWCMTVDETIPFFESINKKISDKLRSASSIMLGHLTIGQPTSTLSGGENIRIKLMKVRTTKADILGVDEPFKGLSNTEIFCVIKFLEELKMQGRTIVVIDHNEQAFPYFQKHIELKMQGNLLVGITL